MDYLGVNYYSRVIVGAGPGPDRLRAGAQFTEMGWEVYPSGLTDLLLRLQQDYPVPPIIVTENGAAFRDEVVDGRVHDPERTTYLARHIRALADALARGVPVTGYMVWSLIDNFEWTSRLHQALRPGARRLRDPAPHAQGQRPLVPRLPDPVARERAPAKRAGGGRTPVGALGPY